MKVLIAILTAVTFSVQNVRALEAGGAGFSLEKIKAADMAAIPAPTLPVVKAPVPAFVPVARQSFLQVEKCWNRDADAEADNLGLPAQFCISRVGVEVPAENPDIFDRGSSILAEDKDGLKRIFITGYAKSGKDRTVIGTLFSGGQGSRAFAAIYLTSSLNGTVRGAIPQIIGFIVAPSSKAREITYRPAAK